MRRAFAALVAIAAALTLSSAASAKVIRVGTYHGIRGQYKSLQVAIKHAHAGDWILIAPGDYKTKQTLVRSPKGAPDFPAAVLITQAHLHIRGMNRNTVVIDGTKSGSARCSRAGSAQNFGATLGASSTSGYVRYAATSAPTGLNGLMVWKARDVSIENLTTCNFLGGSRDTGNAVWWNGGANSGKVGGHGFYGAFLTATSTYLKNQSAAGENLAARYGIFSSNWSGGTWYQDYASNFNDSGFYIGACQQVCDQTQNHIWSEFNALGYSGSNSGGRLLTENSQFDNNEDGFDTNSQNGDNPPPQNGACPAGVKPPVKGAQDCWVFYKNYVHNNNNPNVPAAGSAAAGPVGTGMSVSGARNDEILNNRFENNNAWGVILVPYLDSGGPCTGGTMNAIGSGSCLFDEWGDALIGNQFKNNGSYGHPSNGDFAQVNFESGHPTDCYSGNTEIGGGQVKPATAAAAQTTHPSCNGQPAAAGSTDPSFLNEVLCDSQVELSPGTPSPCPTGPYPRVTKIVMHKLPKHLATMRNPCAGVPKNPWCSKKH